MAWVASKRAVAGAVCRVELAPPSAIKPQSNTVPAQCSPNQCGVGARRSHCIWYSRPEVKCAIPVAFVFSFGRGDDRQTHRIDHSGMWGRKSNETMLTGDVTSATHSSQTCVAAMGLDTAMRHG